MSTLLTPILSNINTFDPSKENLIEFYYEGGQIEKKRLVITDNANSTVVYDKTQLGMKLSFTLSASSIPVGQYTAKIKVIDFDENESEFSDSVLFYCYSSPTLSFSNFPAKNNSSNLTVKLNYSQAENDTLKEYAYYLYDYQKSLVSKTDTYYTTDDMSHTFYGLKNKQTYYIRCVGQTTHDMTADTGLCEVYVDYIVQPNNMLLKLENHKCEGYITVSCNIIDIGYSLENENYILKDSEVILDSNKLTYSSGFDFSDEFSMFVKARNVPLKQPFLSFSTDSGNVTLQILRTCGDYYCEMKAQSPVGNYYRHVKLPNAMIKDNDGKIVADELQNAIEQVTLDYQNNYKVVFEIKRKHNLYSLKAYYEDNGYIEI